MFFLILETLGSTELLFILVMALVFFGPRKLPQLSKSLGKGIAEFKRASEDFKHTWEREVSMEESNAAGISAEPAEFPGENSILNRGDDSRFLPPTIEPVAADQIIPRRADDLDAPNSSDQSDLAADGVETLRKRDWL